MTRLVVPTEAMNVGRLHKGPVPSTSSEVPLQNKEREASKVGREEVGRGLDGVGRGYGAVKW